MSTSTRLSANMMMIMMMKVETKLLENELRKEIAGGGDDCFLLGIVVFYPFDRLYAHKAYFTVFALCSIS